MAAIKRLLSQTTLLRLSFPPPPRRHLLLRRPFSSGTQPVPEPPSQPAPNLREPLPIHPVSYPTKPKPPPPSQESESPPVFQNPSPESQPEARSWTRDDMRYMKDAAPAISTVSYPNRVAPLPEDRVGEREEVRVDRNEELERERRRIDEEGWRGVLRYGKQEEDGKEDKLPFPERIRVASGDQESKKKDKVIYDLKEAIQLVKASGKTTFDETLEVHVKMTTELRRTDLKLSGFVRLPHGFGKTYRVAVFAEGAAADEARDTGADIVGGTELVESIKTGQIKVDFDKCISTVSMMDHVKKLSRNLKALMPDTKKGTLTNDITRAVKEAKEQSVLFKKDKSAIVHVGLGKLSFSEDALRDNVGAFVNALLLAKPAGLKKSSKYAGYVNSFHICSTMGPSFPISIQSLSIAADRYSKMQVQ